MKNWKMILLGLTAFGAGFAGGYFVCKKTLRDQYQEDVEEVKDFYMERLRESGLMEDDDTEEVNPEKAIFEKMMTSYGATLENEKRVDYSTKGKPIVTQKPPLGELIFMPREEDDDDYDGGPDEGDYHDDDEDDEEAADFHARYEAEIEARAEEFASRRHENESNGLPYVITHEEFMNSPDDYDAQMLCYYAKDRTLCEEDDSVVDDEELLVGFDYEDVLDMQTRVWVRNDTLMTVYEIVKFKESYQEAVANVIETPLERDFRIKGRRKLAADMD